MITGVVSVGTDSVFMRIFTPVASPDADTSFSDTRYRLGAVFPTIFGEPDNTILPLLYIPPPLPRPL